MKIEKHFINRKLPVIGYGTYHDRSLRPAGWWDEVYSGTLEALKSGYRLIDCASGYLNEAEVGQAIVDSGLSGEELYITTKMRITEQGYDETLFAFERSMKKLQLQVLDLYMLHWPVPDKFQETWRAMERLHAEGAVRQLGISNFQISHFNRLQETATRRPDVVQMEIHPQLTQKKLIQFYKENKIEVEAWSPLGNGPVLQDRSICSIAERRNRSAAQIILRWHLQNGVVPLPKASGTHIKENLDILTFSLSEEEMKEIDRLNIDNRCIEYPSILSGEYD